MTLIEELRWLRKRSGLVPSRLLSCPHLMQALGTMDQEEAYARLLHDLEALGRSRDALALRNAYGVDASEPGLLTERRKSFGKEYKNRVSTTIEDWENKAIDQLILVIETSEPLRKPRLLLPTQYQSLTVLLNLDSVGYEMTRADAAFTPSASHAAIPLFDIAAKVKHLPRDIAISNLRRYIYRAPDFGFSGERTLTILLVIPGAFGTPQVHSSFGQYAWQAQSDDEPNVEFGKFMNDPFWVSTSGIVASVAEFHWSQVEPNWHYSVAWHW